MGQLFLLQFLQLLPLDFGRGKLVGLQQQFRQSAPGLEFLLGGKPWAGRLQGLLIQLDRPLETAPAGRLLEEFRPPQPRGGVLGAQFQVAGVIGHGGREVFLRGQGLCPFGKRRGRPAHLVGTPEIRGDSHDGQCDDGTGQGPHIQHLSRFLLAARPAVLAGRIVWGKRMRHGIVPSQLEASEGAAGEG